jgi:5'-methylthioadenosine phosphorylase
MTAAAILGSAFAEPGLLDEGPARTVATPFGDAELHPCEGGWALFRHGLPHRYLPHQIPYRAHAWALKELGTTSLLVTSSCGVPVPDLPLFLPHLVGDLLWIDNRLPDGSTCSMWPEPTPGQGHLVLRDGLFSSALAAAFRAIVKLPSREPTFVYTGGPRTKTAAENRLVASMGAEVNSMTLAPEVVLANELELPTLGLVIGHKRSVPGVATPDHDGIAESLVRSRLATADLVRAFLQADLQVPFANDLHRFE